VNSTKELVPPSEGVATSPPSASSLEQAPLFESDDNGSATGSAPSGPKIDSKADPHLWEVNGQSFRRLVDADRERVRLGIYKTVAACVQARKDWKAAEKAREKAKYEARCEAARRGRQTLLSRKAAREELKASERGGGWPARLAALWLEVRGYKSPGEFGRTCHEAIRAHGNEMIEAALRRYLAGTSHPSPSPGHFAGEVKRWLPGGQGEMDTKARRSATATALEGFLEGRSK
jgi:hypothetical protein